MRSVPLRPAQIQGKLKQKNTAVYLIMEVVLDAIAKVVCNVAVFQRDVAPRRIDVNAITPIPSHICVLNYYHRVRLGDI